MWILANENLNFLKAVTKMVQEACTYVDKVDDFEQKIKLIDTLRTVTAGKVWTISQFLICLSLCYAWNIGWLNIK